MGLAHQLEEPGDRRRRIEPVVKPVGVDDHRLSMVDVGKLRARRRRDDGEGLEGFSTPIPTLSQSGERQGRSAHKRQEKGLLAVPGPLPLEPSVGRHQAPA